MMFGDVIGQHQCITMIIIRIYLMLLQLLQLAFDLHLLLFTSHQELLDFLLISQHLRFVLLLQTRVMINYGNVEWLEGGYPK